MRMSCLVTCDFDSQAVLQTTGSTKVYCNQVSSGMWTVYAGLVKDGKGRLLLHVATSQESVGCAERWGAGIYGAVEICSPGCH